MRTTNNRARNFLHSILEPKAIILGFAIFHLLLVLVYVLPSLETENGRTADSFLYYMPAPIILLLAAFSLWRGKLWGYCFALVLSGWLVYNLGYRGLEWVAGELNLPTLNGHVLAQWWRSLFSEWADYPDKPRILFRLALASVICLYSLVSVVQLLLRHVFNKPTASNNSFNASAN